MENFSRASQSLMVARADDFSQYHLFSETCRRWPLKERFNNKNPEIDSCKAAR